VRQDVDVDVNAIQCSRLHMGSLWANNIGAAGARDLGAVLQVNMTLTTLG
jgi:hypothetical protein